MTQPEPPVESTGLSDAAVAALTTAFAAVVLAALSAWLVKAATVVLSAFRRNGGSLDTISLASLDREWSKAVDGLIPDLVRAARAGWESHAAQLGLDVPFNPNDPPLLDQIERSRNLLVRVDDGIYQMVIKAIADGADRGESSTQIAARIEDILNVSGSENWPNRAQVIADTEIRRFTEVGGFAAAERFQVRTARQLMKQWMDERDNRVRAQHRRVNGDRIRLRELFEVGRSLLAYPAAWNGAPEDVINCRCRLKYMEVGRG